MRTTGYQTVKLRRGRHSSPAQGPCVMELASMLAGEPFTDHPRCVSRGIAAFLRTYNDLIDDERRQDLYEFAAKSVGTAGSEEIERRRARRLAIWGDRMGRRRLPWWLGALGRRRPADRLEDSEEAARYAAAVVRKPSKATHEAALALIEDLIRIGTEADAAPAAQSPATAIAVSDDRSRSIMSVDLAGSPERRPRAEVA